MKTRITPASTRSYLSAAFALGSAVLSHAAPLVSGDILVTRQNAKQLIEFTTAGGVVQTFNVPGPAGATETLRDAIVSPNGSVQLYNGTFNPVVTTLTPATGATADRTFAGFATANNVSYGGIGALDSYVYATSMLAGQGIIRFDLSNNSATLFATASGYQDLTIGGNGLLYALPGSNNRIDVFDPRTLALTRSITLNSTLVSADLRGLAVNYDGKIYAAGWNGSIYALDGTGAILNTRVTGFNNLDDIDIDSNGRLLAGSRFGNVVLTTTDLVTQSSFTDSSGSPIFVAWASPIAPAPAPEPGSALAGMLALGVCAGGLLGRRRRE